LPCTIFSLFISTTSTSHEGIKVLGRFRFFWVFFASILPVDYVWWSWCGRAWSVTAPFIKFVIFHLCTARAINASLSAGSFDMKNVILCISGIKLLLFLKPTRPHVEWVSQAKKTTSVIYFHNTRVPFSVYHMPLLRVFWGIFSSNHRKFNS
jgi:hypothetical protein